MATFAGFNTPFVNDATLRRVMSKAVKENIFQNIFTRPNEAVTEKFSEDTDAAEIQVIRVKPNTTDARLIGDTTNGGWFNNGNAANPTTEAYGIRVLTTIDDLIDIPTNMQDMISADLAEAELTNLAGRVHRNINAATIAAQLCTNFNAFRLTADAANKNWVTLAASNPDYLGAIIDAGAKLDDGNTAQGIDAYPDNFRAVFLRSAAKAQLMKKGQIIIGGSDTAQRILRKGGLDADTTPEVATTGYLGEVNNMPCYMASQAVWALAEKYLGLAAGALDGVQMLVVSGIGTGRALAFNSAIKTGDCPLGQGIRIKPKYRFGVECWDALSVVPVVASTFTNPATNSSAVSVKAPGSRAAAVSGT